MANPNRGGGPTRRNTTPPRLRGSVPPPKKVTNLFSSLKPPTTAPTMGNVRRVGSPPPQRRVNLPMVGSASAPAGKYKSFTPDAEDVNPVDWWRDPSIYNKIPSMATSTSGGGGGGEGGGGGWTDWGGGGGGWDGGGGGGEPAPISWSEFDAGVSNKPAWWKALKPSDMNEGTEFLASLNLLIPFLSAEDQRSVAATLYAQDAKNFGHLSPEKIGVSNPAISPDLQKYFTSSNRANQALSALDKLASVAGKSEADMGSGYRYLRSILSAVKSYGAQEGESRMTRANSIGLYSALDPLLNQSKTGELGAYGPLASMLSKPFFSGGNLMPIGKTQDGRYIFGNANKALL